MRLRMRLRIRIRIRIRRIFKALIIMFQTSLATVVILL
jgi:hypothetical protein